MSADEQDRKPAPKSEKSQEKPEEKG